MTTVNTARSAARLAAAPTVSDVTLRAADASARAEEMAHIPNNPKKNRTAGDWVLLVLLIIGGLIMLFPLLVLLLNAFKTPTDYNMSGPLSWPREFSLNGVIKFWNAVNFPQKLWNSIWTSLLVAFLACVFSVLNSFALGIGRIHGRRGIVLLIMLANMMPEEALLYPLYIMFKGMGLYDNIWSIVIVYTVIQSAFGTYLLSSVYGTFPQAILEAATIDGASRWRILRDIVLPISRPTLAVMMTFFFVWTWNEYMIPMSFLVDNSTQTVPIAIASLSGQRLMDVTTTAAASLISILPTLIFYLIFQRTLNRGIVAGAVK